ncbi:MAG: 30S ribosomal protein S12 methylthiotransferase RimO [Clostridia bacterium]|nr:30S ribosomal protein S12 methylthiotransferase RimO [Clostridia bacterium]
MKVFFDTLGCPKNFNDTQAAKGILEKAGYTIVDDPSVSDFNIVNTCGFINDAKVESIQHIFDMANYDGKLVVSGCLAQRYYKDLIEEMPEVDKFIGVNDYEALPDFLKSDEKVLVSGCSERVLKTLPRKFEDNPYTATIKIAEGCNNHCAYCVIPSIRGYFRSKRQEDILAEAKELAKRGMKELILIAQDVTLYGIDLYKEYRLPKLLKELCKIDGIKWIRLMYCYEDRITDELIQVMKEEEKICKYIDIPIQHSEDNVLKAMNRRSTKASILDTIDRLRKAIPDIHIRTTLIVGFPGESEEDFENLLDFVESTRFARLGAFAYSREENTVAGDMEGQIDEEIKAMRADQVMRTQLEISLSLNQKKIGKTVEVLVEGLDDERDNSYIGRSSFDAPEIDNSVIFTSEKTLKPGQFVNVLVTDAYDYDLVGKEV